MSGWVDLDTLLTEVSESEVRELDRYVGDKTEQHLDRLERSDRAAYLSGAWLNPGVSKRRSGRHHGDRKAK